MYKTRKRYRGEPICADPTADPRENETALHFTAGDRRFWVSSYEPTVVAGLLAHPDFQIGHLVVMEADGRECVVGVVGKLPVGALSLGQARQSDSHELIVSNKIRLTMSHGHLERASSKRQKKNEKDKKKSLEKQPRRISRKAYTRAKRLRRRSRR